MTTDRNIPLNPKIEVDYVTFRIVQGRQMHCFGGSGRGRPIILVDHIAVIRPNPPAYLLAFLANYSVLRYRRNNRFGITNLLALRFHCLFTNAVCSMGIFGQPMGVVGCYWSLVWTHIPIKYTYVPISRLYKDTGFARILFK